MHRLRANNLWVVVLLLVLVVVLPSATVLWMTGVAVRNEQAAIRQRLVNTYDSQLKRASVQWERHWAAYKERCSKLANQYSGAELFAACCAEQLSDTVLVISPRGELIYPTFDRPASQPSLNADAWEAARRLEFTENEYSIAAEAYAAIASAEPDLAASSGAWIAHSRCLEKQGLTTAAIDILLEKLPPLNAQTGTELRFWLNAHIRAIELMMQSPDDKRLGEVTKQVVDALNDYGNEVSSTQRLFAMNRLNELGNESDRDRPASIEFPSLKSEQLADDFWANAEQELSPSGTLWSLDKDLHCVTFRDEGLVMVFRPEGWRAEVARILEPWQTDESRIAVVAADKHVVSETEVASVRLPSTANRLLVMSLNASELLEDGSRMSTTLYIGAGLLTIAASFAGALLVVVLVRQQLRTAQLRTDLTAFVSHELRTPLASMRVLVDTMLDKPNADLAKHREYLELIAQQNERLSGLVNNFLMFSRFDQDRSRLEAQSVAPAEIANQAIGSMGPRLREPQCHFTLKMQDHLPCVNADHGAMVTTVLNLLDNACKFSDGKPEIRMQVWAEDNSVYFRVSDSGVGMTSAQQRRIFDRHYQADMRLARKHGGCGLGLSLIRQIIEWHHGSVDVVSTPNTGSVFTVSIPISRDAVGSVTESSQCEQPQENS